MLFFIGGYSMRKLCIYVAIVAIILSAPIYAGEKVSIAERKAIQNSEYGKCMAITKEYWVLATIRYIREKQKGTTLKSTPTTLAEENCAADSIGLARYQTLDEIGDDCDTNNLVSIDSSLIEIKDKLPNAYAISEEIQKQRILRSENCRDFVRSRLTRTICGL
jgi:hypothetical protein